MTILDNLEIELLESSEKKPLKTNFDSIKSSR